MPEDFPTGPRWVVHLPIAVPNLPAALTVAEQIVASLGWLEMVDAGSVEVSEEDDQARRRGVFCNRLVAGRSRCGRRRAHGGRCRPSDQRPMTG
jgi:hypothetical protein